MKEVKNWRKEINERKKERKEKHFMLFSDFTNNNETIIPLQGGA